MNSEPQTPQGTPVNRGTLGVIGLGYVGLPLVVAAARAGWTVRGYDRSAPVCAALNTGHSHVDDINDDDLLEARRLGFVASPEHADLGGCDVIVICVPTPLDATRQPDLTAVVSASHAVASVLRPGMLVVLESTTYPGTTEELVAPALAASGLRPGIDVSVAFSPERIDPGNPTWNLINTPKVVGGLTPGCTAKAAAFYRTIVDEVVPVRGTREAETAKLLENTYRHVNIALVNEMARFCHELGIDIWDVVRAAGTKPFGFQSFRPGPGVGGHCIPIDPNYLSWRVRAKLGYPFRMVELAEEINERMPDHVARRLQDLLNDQGRSVRGSHILLLGVTYKPGIADVRETPAHPLASRLRQMGARLSFHDPLVQSWSVNGVPVPRVEDPAVAAEEMHVTVLLQNHDSYDLDKLGDVARLLFDTRGAATGRSVVRL